MLHCPFCAGASRIRAWKWTRSSTSRPASRSPESAAPTAGSCSATCARRSRRATCCAQIPIDDLIERVRRAGELYMDATLPMGDGTQTPDEFVRAQSASTGTAGAHVPRQHEEERVRAERDAQHPRVAHARLVARRPSAGTAKSAACRSATRRRARCSAWCCRRIRPGSTRCGCRSSRCRSAWC